MPIHIWHGEEDRLVPPAQSRILAQALPAATTHFVLGEEHFSLDVNRVGDILKSALTD